MNLTPEIYASAFQHRPQGLSFPQILTVKKLLIARISSELKAIKQLNWTLEAKAKKIKEQKSLYLNDYHQWLSEGKCSPEVIQYLTEEMQEKLARL